MAENEEVQEPEQSKPEVPNYQANIGFLTGVSIQLHEMFMELKKAGFYHEDALHLTGMVLETYFPPPYPDMMEDDLDEIEGSTTTMEYLDEEDLDDDM